MQKPQRNMPCVCGSGKKYKHCCMKMVHLKERWHVFANSLQGRLSDFGFEKRFASDFEHARKQHPDGDSEDAPGPMLEWYSHDYILEHYGKTIMELFTDENRENLSNLEVDMLSKWSKSPLSIYEVTDVKKGIGISIKDIFDDTNYFMYDTKSSLRVVAPSYILMRLYDAGEIVMNSGIAEIVFVSHKKSIVEFVQHKVKKSRHADVRQYLKENSLDVMLHLRSLQHTSPVLTTGDGQPLSIATALYMVNVPCLDICDMFDTIKGFIYISTENGTYTYNMVEVSDERDSTGPDADSGADIKVGVTTMREGKPLRILANIDFDTDMLTVFCLSDQMLYDVKALIEKTLGSMITHKKDVIKDVDSAIAESKSNTD